MIPGSSVEFSLELVGVALSGWDRALVNTGHTVFPRCSGLKEAVPVESCAFGLTNRVLRDVVVDGDLNRISPVRLDRRPGEGSIDEQNGFLISIWSQHSSTDGEVVRANYTGVGRLSIRAGVCWCSGSPWEAVGKGVVRKKEREQYGLQSTIE